MRQVQLSDVTKVYDDVRAVEDIGLSVRDGESRLVMGPSSCGKSTTLRMIAGLETITGGKIAIGDQGDNDVRPQDRNIPMVFQNYALYPHMTVRENMSLGLRHSEAYSDEVIDERVEEAAELLESPELPNQLPRQLSGGQHQRVALGQSTVRDRDVFLMDEPLSNLDAKLRTQVRTELQRIQEELGVPTIYVIHDQTETMTMGERITMLHEGEIQQVDEPAVCYDRANNKFVAGFIGSPSMNFFDVNVVPTDDGIQVTGDGFETTLPVALGAGPYTLGVRPEDLTVATDSDHFGITVDVVEPIGSDNFLYLHPAEGDGEVVARVDGEFHPEPGETISLGFESVDAQFSDETGNRVPLGDETDPVTAC